MLFRSILIYFHCLEFFLFSRKPMRAPESLEENLATTGMATELSGKDLFRGYKWKARNLQKNEELGLKSI